MNDQQEQIDLIARTIERKIAEAVAERLAQRDATAQPDSVELKVEPATEPIAEPSSSLIIHKPDMALQRHLLPAKPPPERPPPSPDATQAFYAYYGFENLMRSFSR